MVDEGGELGAGGRVENVANPLFANAIGTELPVELKRKKHSRSSAKQLMAVYLARLRHKLIPAVF